MFLNSAAVMVSVPPVLTVGEGDQVVPVCATLFAMERIGKTVIVTLTTNGGTGWKLVL